MMGPANTRTKKLQMKPLSRAVILACAGTGVAFSPMAAAQDDLVLDEIIVSAQKRDQSLQAVRS